MPDNGEALHNSWSTSLTLGAEFQHFGDVHGMLVCSGTMRVRAA
jgi:hypothetical protein